MSEDFEEESPINNFKVGDWVMIRYDFDENRFLNDPGIVPEMLEEKGKVTQIKNISDTSYFLDKSRWTWCKEWLAPCDPDKNINIDESDIISLLE